MNNLSKKPRKDLNPSSGVKPKGKRQEASNPKSHIHRTLLTHFGDGLVTEHIGIPGRRFRFDWAVPTLKLAIEYEGIYGRGRSRHTTVTGYTKDTEKYNLATLHDWTVLRYTAKNYTNLEDDLKLFYDNNG